MKLSTPISQRINGFQSTYLIILFKAGLRVGWDGTKKIVPWDKNFFNYTMGWDDKVVK